MRPMFDYEKLRQRICEKFHTQENFARAAGISPVVLAGKLDNANDFTRDEIVKVRDFLEIGDEDISAFFFEKNKRYSLI